MAWFRIDDQFHSHPKVMASRNGALGLWVRCGAWSSAHGTDGFIPRDVVLQFSEHSSQQSGLLLVGLWSPVGTRYPQGSGPDGVLMHDFLDYNPSAKEVSARRDWETQRKAAARARKAALQQALWNGEPP